MLENKYKGLDKKLQNYVKEAFLDSIFYKYQEECDLEVKMEREDEDLSEKDRRYDDIDVGLKCNTEMDREEMVMVLVEDLDVSKEDLKEEFLKSFKLKIKNEYLKKQKALLKAGELYIDSILNDCKGYYEANITDIWDSIDE